MKLAKRIRNLRILTASLFLLLILGGAIVRNGCGSSCALTILGLSFTCPLGFLQASLASRTLVLKALLSAGLVVALTLLLGRFFCSWLCPTQLIKVMFPGKSAPSQGQGKPKVLAASTQAMPNADTLGSQTARYGSYAVLGGSLLSSLIFGFPVFCLICPVGLFFGTLFAVQHLFISHSLSLELLLFPGILVLEIFVLRKWCSRLCPLGALLGLIGAANNQVLRPQVNSQDCMKEQGFDCKACQKACPEGIDPSKQENLSLNGCTNCLSCYARCPKGSIRLLPASLRASLRRMLAFRR